MEVKRRQIASLEKRLQLTLIEIKKKTEQIAQLEAELEILKSEPNNIQVLNIAVFIYFV